MVTLSNCKKQEHERILENTEEFYRQLSNYLDFDFISQLHLNCITLHVFMKRAHE